MREFLLIDFFSIVPRSGFVSLRIIYETDEAPGSSNNSVTNKTT